MNPDTNKFEKLTEEENESIKSQVDALSKMTDKNLPNLLRPNGEPVPKHWSVFTVGEMVTIKDYTFKVAYIGESNILFEPVSPIINNGGKE